jgi:DMSO/TMAO reductase YedYZ heme-binding membrane subunit
VFEEEEKWEQSKEITARLSLCLSLVVLLLLLLLQLTSEDEYFKTRRAPSWFEVSVLRALRYYFLGQ